MPNCLLPFLFAAGNAQLSTWVMTATAAQHITEVSFSHCGMAQGVGKNAKYGATNMGQLRSAD
jgi:hypothetical protein